MDYKMFNKPFKTLNRSDYSLVLNDRQCVVFVEFGLLVGQNKQFEVISLVTGTV